MIRKILRSISEHKIKIKGRLDLMALDADGNVLWTEKTENLVVTTGRTQLCRLLAGDVTNRSITQIGFGTNGTATALTDAYPLTGQYKKAIGTASYPTSSSVQFAWTLGTSEGNGMTIQEFGLICANDTLFSRLTRGAIAKTSAIQLVGTWTLSF